MSLADQLEFETFAEWADVAHIADRPIAELISEIQTLYQMDSRPWVVGFSGGKDSTVVLQLIYQSIENLSPDERTKPVFVISSDTLVETPMVADLISGTRRKEERSTHHRRHCLPENQSVVLGQSLRERISSSNNQVSLVYGTNED